jgi:(p)ppGpp synthase/HD superfamily hydrolase
MTESERERLVEALHFALAAHGDQLRKGTGVPYASHLLQVCGLVFEFGGDVDQAVAALLHDAVEDCVDVQLTALRDRFGAEVARIVGQCTDLLENDAPDAKSDWLARKRSYISRLHDADERVRLVAACDKLHNLRSLLADLDAEGVATLERFTATPAQTRWYYEQVRSALGERIPAALGAELDALLGRLAGYVAVASPEG